MLRRLLNLLTKDITGRTRTRDVTHPYFGQMIRFSSSEDPTTDYWEAEFTPPDLGKPVSIIFSGTEVGPEDAEVSFTRDALGDLDGLFEKCRAAFTPEFQQRAHHPLPQDWRSAFQLDGIKVPRAGQTMNDWNVCYFVKPVGRYFSAYFEGGAAVRVVVDG